MSLQLKTKKPRGSAVRGGWKRREAILLLERLQAYASSGLSIDRSLQILEEGASKRQKASLRQMRREVESGRSLGDSMAAGIRLPATVLSLIRHGESSGRLPESLSAARTMLEHGEDLKKKLGSAMAYPVVIGIFAALLTLGLVRGVMPQIIPMLVSLHVELPILTRIVIACSEGLIGYGLYGSIALAIAAAILVAAYRKSVGFRLAAQSLLLRIPLAGRLYADYCISILLQSCGSLIESGAPAGASYARSVAALSFLPIKRRLEAKAESLNRGEQVHRAFQDRAISAFVPSLLSAGEMSGTLGASMVRAAAILDRDIEHSLRRLTSLVEPIMMAGMGLIVGAIALSIVMPIYDISKVLQR